MQQLKFSGSYDLKEKLCLIKKRITKYDIGQDALFPMYNSDREFVKKTESDKEILCSSHQARNPRHHKLIFAIAKCVIDNLPDDHFLAKASAYEFIKACMIAEGIVDTYYNLDGTVRFEPKSVSFQSMDREEFEKVSDAIFKHGAILLDAKEDHLRENYSNYL